MSYLKAKMHKIRFLLGLRPRSRWGVCSAPPDLLAGFKGPTSKVRGRGGRAGEGDGRERSGRGNVCLLLNRGLVTPLKLDMCRPADCWQVVGGLLMMTPSMNLTWPRPVPHGVSQLIPCTRSCCKFPQNASWPFYDAPRVVSLWLN